MIISSNISLSIFLPLILHPFINKQKNYIRLTINLIVISLVFGVIKAIWNDFAFYTLNFLFDVVWALILFGFVRLIYIFLDSENPKISSVKKEIEVITENKPRIYQIIASIFLLIFTMLSVFIIVKSVSLESNYLSYAKSSYAILLSVTVPMMVLVVLDYILKANKKLKILLIQNATAAVIYFMFLLIFNIQENSISEIFNNEVRSNDFIMLMFYGFFIGWTIISYLDNLRKQV